MTLESTGGNRARAAELLGVSLRTVRNKVREFGLPPRDNYRNGLSNHELSGIALPGDGTRTNIAQTSVVQTTMVPGGGRSHSNAGNIGKLENINRKEQPCP